ncbi:MAG TPA: GNAT family N-acetyltransferase [Gemmatimonadales bacterium]|nr:GNAT family N-acetyltransferase [Gemmatimonadales bacterium]
MTSPSSGTRVHRLGAGDVAAVTSTLADAFHDYPVMRYTVGDGADYDARLATLVRFFVMARVLRDEPILGVYDGDGLAAAALVSNPANAESPLALGLLREEVWSAVGAEARARYEAIGAVWRTFDVEEPTLHLNMVGVRRGLQRRGLGRALLDEVHRMAAGTPGVEGVTLTTEDPVNVALYEHVGYVVRARQPLVAGLTTWGLFRPVTRPAGAPPRE